MLPPATSEPERHVVAIGGGGLAPEDRALRTYLLALTGKDEPRVCFVGTASGDDDFYADRFFASFDGMPCRLSRLTVLKPMAGSAEEHLAEQDVVYVGGGSAFHMLVLWRSLGLDAHLRHAWERGAVMCGVSAGSMCWYESGIRARSESDFAPLEPLLGLLPGSSCPHYDSQPQRRAAYLGLVAERRLPAGCGIDDGAAVHYIGTEVAEVVTFRPGAAAYLVEASAEGPTERAMASRALRSC